MVGPVDALVGDEDRPVEVLDLDRSDHAEALSTAPVLALDLETDNFHAYRERTCLLQLATPERDWFFDPLGLEALPPALTEALGREDREVILHAGDNDVRSLVRDFGLRLGRLFDTALAARILGLAQLGLKGLLENVVGVEIDKGEQRSDWSRRPLAVEQLRYARQDVRWLTQLRERLAVLLDEKGRRAWHEEECERTRWVEPTEKRFDPESWRKVKAAKSLGPRGRAVMATLWRWRESEAEARNTPAVRVAYPEQLARVAKVADAHGDRVLEKLPGFTFLPPGLDRDKLRTVVESGLAAPDPGSRRPPRTRADSPPALDADGRARLERLREGRAQWAADLGMDPGFLLANALLERIARAAPQGPEDLKGVNGLGRWRAEALGQEIMHAVCL